MSPHSAEPGVVSRDLSVNTSGCLGVTRPGSLRRLAYLRRPEQPGTLGPREVRIAVYAAGLNFRDILTVVGRYPTTQLLLGLEAAGVVIGAGAEVRDLAVGDRVFGLAKGAFGAVTTTDERLVALLPPDWTYAQGASVSLAFLTAIMALEVCAGLRPGQTVLVHAAAGGVGMAAVQLAFQRGAEVFGTAQPAKWPMLKAAGLDDAHLASTRDLEFAEKFEAATEGRGLDVIVNSLAGDYARHSARLVGATGHFVELGLTDRAPASPGKWHRLHLDSADKGWFQPTLYRLVAMFSRGELRHLPLTLFDISQAQEAFQLMARSRHVGKVVLTLTPGE
jgi:NADPH:quinone reductase-like Zn-dependent oxidoreductase